MINDQFDIINRMLFLNQFGGLSTLEKKRSLYTQFEELFNDGGSIEFYNNHWENENIRSFFNGEKVNLWGSV